MARQNPVFLGVYQGIEFVQRGLPPDFVELESFVVGDNEEIE